ncbi:MAG: TetR/AcrR family transcriptional regulator [Acutalibacteraceae bacterium]
MPTKNVNDGVQLCKSTFDRLPEEKRLRILRAAVEEFADNGFEHTSVQQIAKKASISVGSVYKYFESKEKLFTMVIQTGLSSLENLLYGLSESDEDIFFKAEKIIKEIIRFSKEQPEYIKLYNHITTSNNSKLIDMLSQRIEAISASIYTVAISKAQETGDVRSDINPAMFAFLLDNLFMMLQFTTACDYYKERFLIYTGKDIYENEDVLVGEMLKFLKAAFNFK